MGIAINERSPYSLFLFFISIIEIGPELWVLPPRPKMPGRARVFFMTVISDGPYIGQRHLPSIFAARVSGSSPGEAKRPSWLSDTLFANAF